METIKKTDYPRNFYRDSAADDLRAARRCPHLRRYYEGRAQVWKYVDIHINAAVERLTANNGNKG